ncbi:MAG: histidine phosphatase family protein [Lautropia sp.]|nr:histidine phosphatase family protein [Lautropia sp.]
MRPGDGLPELEADALSQEVRLILMRHGETDWNRAQRIQGQLDQPLNAVGFAQAQAAARRFAPGMVDAVYSSDLLRARQTATPVSERTGVPLLTDSVWRERHFGRFQGWRYADVAQAEPDIFRRMQAREPDLDLSGGESLLQVRARAESALQALVDRHRGQRVVVVAHGGVLDAVYRLVTGMPLSAPRDFSIHNACICLLCWRSGAWSIERWGDITHLAAREDDLDAPGVDSLPRLVR